MTDITPDPRATGSHRRTDRRRLRLLLVSLLVVVIAAGAVIATLHWRGEDKHHPTLAAAKTTHPTPPSSTSASTAAVASTPAAASSSPPLPSATAGTPAGPSSAGPSPTTAGPAAHLPVDVLNNTHTSGLAARAAQKLTAGGWTVAETGNYPHTVSATTVYYPAGALASAQLLAKQFPAIGRVVAAPVGVSTTHLTLVLGKDWVS
jgi:hypothetical protein